MYTPKGFGYSEVGDIEVFADGDDLHLYHLTLPNHDVVQHVVSRDGLAWEQLPPALWTGAPGDVDDDQIWTMSVTDGGDGTFHMLYTALARAEDGLVQRVAHATSTDLVTFEKTSNRAVAEADPEWYESTLAESGAVSFRDPKPVRWDGRWLMAVCARVKGGPVMRRGAVALLESDDLRTWTHRGPVIAPGRYWDLECPQIFEVAGRWYLTAGIMEDGTQRYWQAETPEGPYRVPADGGILVPQGHYAGRVVRWRGQDLYLCWHRPLGHHGPTLVDWATQRNSAGKFVPAPLVLEPRDEGSLRCAPFAGWDGYRDAALDLGDGEWRVDAPAGGRDEATVDAPGDFTLEGTLTLDAPMGGFTFRTDGETGEGYTIEFVAGRTEVALQRLELTTNRWTGQQGFRYVEYQRGRLPSPIARGVPMAIRLVVSGPSVELAVDGEVVLSTLTGFRTEGTFGLWADGGTIALANAVAWSLRPVPSGAGPSAWAGRAAPASQ
jgi:beta-fructofuranosidase